MEPVHQNLWKKTDAFLVIINGFKVAEETAAKGLFNYREQNLAGSIRTKMFLDVVDDINKLVMALRWRNIGNNSGEVFNREKVRQDFTPRRSGRKFRW